MRPPGEIERLIRLLARLPGLGPRSARRAALYLLQRHETVLYPLAEALQAAGKNIRRCGLCNTLDTSDPCGICRDPARDPGLVCVVEQVADQWAVERTGIFTGRYHVLGGVLSALDGIGPEGLGIDRLIERIAQTRVYEVILALNATVDGQTTAHYLAERLQESGVTVTRLAHGVPVGGELDYLDDGTLTAALTTRRRAE